MIAVPARDRDGPGRALMTPAPAVHAAEDGAQRDSSESPDRLRQKAVRRRTVRPFQAITATAW